jgi:hypothetical protein
MSTLERAIALAATVHAGQRDKGGAPYILQPLRMMLKMNTTDTQMAAVLHDVVEDCGVTPALLTYEGFPADRKFKVPTRRPNVPPAASIRPRARLARPAHDSLGA